MLLALLAPAVLAERALCESWCADVPCAELNGDAASECGACGPASACWPGAIPSKDDAQNDDSCRPANEEVSTEAACAFQRLSASSFHARSPAERARFLQRPTVIEGLIEDWPAMATLAGQQELVIRSAPPDPMRSHAVSAAAKEEEGTLGRRSGRVDVLGGQRSSRPTELV